MSDVSYAPVPLLDDDRAPTRELGVLTSSGGRTLPLVAVSIHARAGVLAAETTIEQRFANPFDEPIEVTYTFPLAGECAVRDFELRVGARIVRGDLAERAAGRQQYARAIAQGHRASILEQERDGVFTIQVGNVLPGDDIVIRIEYCEQLTMLGDGRAELRLPLVVAPRYMRGQPLDGAQSGTGVELDTDTVPDASRLSPPRLTPGFDPETALSIEVEVSGRVGELVSTQHAIQSTIDDDRVRVTLAAARARLDRDFVLRWGLTTKTILPQLVRHDDFAMITVVAPPDEGGPLPARDVVFVLDRSGSMAGEKLVSAGAACGLLLRSLGSRDRFRLLAFDDRMEWMADDFAAADENGITRGERWLSGIDARGGTEINQALDGAWRAFPKMSATETRERVVILLTDGQVGDESGALRIVQQGAADVRLFTIGIDTAVNDGLLRRLAKLGRGSAFFVEPGAKLDDALRSIARQIGTPVIMDLAIAGVREVAPSRLPDLFAGQHVAAFARTTADVVELTGRRRDGSMFRVSLTPEATSLPAIEQLWARSRIMELENAIRVGGGVQLREEIVALSLRHRVLSRLTAFVSVDSEQAVAADGATPRAVVQPVEMPALWEQPADAMMASFHMASPAPAADYLALHESAPPIARARTFKAPSSTKLGGLLSSLGDVMRPRRSATDDTKAAWSDLLAAIDALRMLVAEMRRVLESGARPQTDALRRAIENVGRMREAFEGAGSMELDRILAHSAGRFGRAIDDGAETLELLSMARELDDDLESVITDLRMRSADGSGPQRPFWQKTL